MEAKPFSKGPPTVFPALPSTRNRLWSIVRKQGYGQPPSPLAFDSRTSTRHHLVAVCLLGAGGLRTSLQLSKLASAIYGGSTCAKLTLKTVAQDMRAYIVFMRKRGEMQAVLRSCLLITAKVHGQAFLRVRKAVQDLLMFGIIEGTSVHL